MRGSPFTSVPPRLAKTGNSGAKLPLSALLSALRTGLKDLALLLGSLYFAILPKMSSSLSDFKIKHIHDKTLEIPE